jgi:hypothetical protein
MHTSQAQRGPEKTLRVKGGMMKQTIKHGAEVDFATPDEVARLIASMKNEDRPSRVRAPMTLQLDANGNGQDEVFSVPMGFEFEARRVVVDVSAATGPDVGNITLAAGRTLAFLRSGQRIEWGAPTGPAGTPQVPGVQTWGAEQGPYLRNGEVFEIAAVLGVGAANAQLTGAVEGILRKIGP